MLGGNPFLQRFPLENTQSGNGRQKELKTKTVLTKNMVSKCLSITFNIKTQIRGKSDTRLASCH